MPFPMTHLSIAWNLLQRTERIRYPNSFLLGALAPDSIHVRSDYDSDMKKASHLTVGPEKWGSLTNNREWAENVMAFVNGHLGALSPRDREFLLGYASHILSDIQNNIRIWIPYKESLGGQVGRLGSTSYHVEAHRTDCVQHAEHPERERFWTLLRAAPIGWVPPMLLPEEVELQRRHVLDHLYAEPAERDLSGHRYITMEVMARFIDAVTEDVAAALFAEG